MLTYLRLQLNKIEIILNEKKKTFFRNFLLLLRETVVPKVITKREVGSLTMQPAKHDDPGMPLYRMYPSRCIVQLTR